MTSALTPSASVVSAGPTRFPRRRFVRSGIVNVHRYGNEVFEHPGGRFVLRGTNGSGKSRAMEMLHPFLISGDRRRLSTTGTKDIVTINSLMQFGLTSVNRVGYVWVECVDEDGDHTTIGAYLRYSDDTKTSTVLYFITSLRVGIDLHLVDDKNNAMPRSTLYETVGADKITDSATVHRDRVAREVFDLVDERGRERYRAHLDMVHTLRSPGIGVRIEEGKVASLLSDSLPPLADEVLQTYGGQLDELAEARAGQERLERELVDIESAVKTYTGYVTGVVTNSAQQVTSAADAADEARTAEQMSQRTEQDGLTALQTAEQELARLEGALEDHTARKSGLEQSQRYKNALADIERQATVDALEGAADTSLSAHRTARGEHVRAVTAATMVASSVKTQVDDVSTALGAVETHAAAAGIPHDLPTLRADVTTPEAGTEKVRISSRSQETAEQVAVPTAVTVTPNDPNEVAEKVRRTRTAASTKTTTAESRLENARHLTQRNSKVEAQEDQAKGSAERARDALENFRTASAAASTAEANLIVQWHEWMSSEPVVRLRGGEGWDGSALNVLLEHGTLPPLDILDRAAEAAMLPIRLRTGQAAAETAATDAAAEAEQQELTIELKLRRDEVGEPPTQPLWATVVPEEPFWRAVDFREDVTEDVRAQLESALHTSGILTAAITQGGAVAENGQLLVSPAGEPATQPLASVLRATPNAPEPTSAILERIGFNDAHHPVNVRDDGSWRTGMLTGRSIADRPARHIGAAARERARKEQIVRIEEQLAELVTHRANLAEQARHHVRTQKEITETIAVAPISAQLRSAEILRDSKGADAEKASIAAKTASAVAADARERLDADAELHRRACEFAGLPWTETGLRESWEAAQNLDRACEAALTAIRGLIREIDRHAESLTAASEAGTRAKVAGEEAAERWRSWHFASVQLEQARASVGIPVADILDEIAALEAVLGRAQSEQRAMAKSIPGLAAGHAAAKTTAAARSEDRVASVVVLTTRVTTLRRLLALPGVSEAALGEGEAPTVAPVDATTARSYVRQITGMLQSDKPVDEDGVIRAIESLRENLTPSFDVNRAIRDGVHIVDLSDAETVYSLPSAHTAIRARSSIGRETLTRTEHGVFQRFILEGIGAELRRSILLAEQVIDETNERIRGRRTSNGIGVRLRFTPNDTLGDGVGRIRTLVGIPDAIRTGQQTEELTGLLRAHVETAYEEDPASGYISALTAALDYRRWFIVEAIVLGPNEGQERNLLRAGLSSGELRWVSYMVLICALDAHVSAFPPAAPRLLMLDDAFAMVDDHGRRGLLKIIIERDIDFVMTGFDLWLAFPEIPSLDLYDVKATGNHAVTVHFHWDGRHKHLRPV